MAASRLSTAASVSGLLVCGSVNTVTLKIAYTMSSINSSGQEAVFQKPWFTTLLMFVAMTFALIFDRDMRRWCCGGGAAKKQERLLQPDTTPRNSAEGGSAGSTKTSWARKVALVRIPAAFDILATGMCNMGMLYIPASVWQLLRGAEMVFAALLARFCLKTCLDGFHWFGVLLCSLGVVLVGLASVWGSAEDPRQESAGGEEAASLLLFGMTMAVLGQVVQAAQVIAEEWLLKDVDLPEMQVIGFEGAWGVLLMMPLLVAFFALPGSDHGHFEDELDTMVMLRDSLPISGLLLLYTVSCTTYNMAGIAVTGALSAVHRVMLEALRTSVVWGWGLLVHAVDPASKFGEVWTQYSVLELLGFALIILGQAVYGGQIRVPCFRYPERLEEPKALHSPGGLRNITSPLPAGAVLSLQEEQA